jgi:outer membrane cobalamin receptor
MQVTNGYAYLRSTNLAPYIPGHKWNASIDYDAGKAYLHVGATTVGRRWSNTGRTAQLGGYTSATLKCTVPVSKRQTLFVMLDNLLDHRYEVVPGYPMPGLNASGGFSLEF